MIRPPLPSHFVRHSIHIIGEPSPGVAHNGHPVYHCTLIVRFTELFTKSMVRAGVNISLKDALKTKCNRIRFSTRLAWSVR